MAGVLVRATVTSLAGILAACSMADAGSGPEVVSSADTPDVAGGSDGGTTASDRVSVWLLDVDGSTAAVIGGGSAVNVQAVEVVEVDGASYVQVTASGLPDYEHTVTESDLAFLVSRPKAARDFVTGAPTVEVGDVVAFGQDIGYRSTGCDDTAGSGYGYWPPGPACPVEQDYVDVLFPLEPTLATGEHTDTALGAIGLWVNGVAIFGWGDGQSWDGAGVWENLAPVAEAYDLDLCPGHSAGGQYHHHSHPTCLADQLGDDGTAHSPIHGFAADGFPVHGPWVADGELARSSWVARDYDDPASATGCGVAGERTCLLVDVTDPGAGTVAASSDGPSTSGQATSLSGNVFDTTSGWFKQDWWFDADLDDGSLAALDEFNGHEHDGLGYHYHVTRRLADDRSLVDAFPYHIGIQYAGVLADGNVTTAGGALRGGPPGGGPPGGGAP